MVRRERGGAHTAGDGSRLQQARPNSVAGGETSASSRVTPSPPKPMRGSAPHSPQKKSSSVSSKTRGQAGYWRSKERSPRHGGGSYRNGDSNFLIADEDFPALPGVRGGGHHRGSRHQRKESAPTQSNSQSQSKNHEKPVSTGTTGTDVRPDSAGSVDCASSLSMGSTDSGVGTGGHSQSSTPSRDEKAANGAAETTMVSRPESKDKSPTEVSRPSSTSDRHGKPSSTRKTVPKTSSDISPASSVSGVASRAASALSQRSQHSPYGVSPNKKKGPVSSNTPSPPSFIKLSKMGQKVAERRGGGSTQFPFSKPVSSSPSTPPLSVSSPSSQSEKESPELLKSIQSKLTKIDENREKQLQLEFKKFGVGEAKKQVYGGTEGFDEKAIGQELLSELGADANIFSSNGVFENGKLAGMDAAQKVSSLLEDLKMASEAPQLSSQSSVPVFHNFQNRENGGVLSGEQRKTPHIIISEDGEMSNIPASMLADQFGIAALFQTLVTCGKRGGATAPSESKEETMDEKMKRDIYMLTVGLELPDLGVALKDSNNEPQWKKFGGPLGEAPLPPTAMTVEQGYLPKTYYTNCILDENKKMTNRVPEKLTHHDLFYIFYNCPGELWQLNAARELTSRGWMFNKKERFWLRGRLSERENVAYAAANKDANYEIGIFDVYDPLKARIMTRELRFPRSDIEQVPGGDNCVAGLQWPSDLIWGKTKKDASMFNPVGDGGGLSTYSLAPGSGAFHRVSSQQPVGTPSKRVPFASRFGDFGSPLMFSPSESLRGGLTPGPVMSPFPLIPPPIPNMSMGADRPNVGMNAMSDQLTPQMMAQLMAHAHASSQQPRKYRPDSISSLRKF